MNLCGKIRPSPRERGAITPVLALTLAMGLGFLALTVDVGQLFVVKNELQNIADAAALAGAKKLIQAKDPANPGLAAVYCEEALAAAQAVAQKNRSLGQNVTISPEDVIMGQWDLRQGVFTRTGCSTNPMEVTAIQVTVRRDGNINPQVTSIFGHLLGGSRQLPSSATAVAYLGLAGTSSLSLPFAVPPAYAAGQGPYAQPPRWWDFLSPTPALANAQVQEYTWRDLGGSTLDTSRATFIMPLESERTSLSKLQQYIKGPNQGGTKYPQVKVGQKVYPISEYRWPSNVYDNFNYLRNRFNAEKGQNGKWRVTAAVYATSNPLAELPVPDSWLRLAGAFRLGPREARACASYTVPAVYVQGFITLDIKQVLCDYNDDGTWDSTCKNYSYGDSRSCDKKCRVVLEVPLNQNFVSVDRTATPMPRDRSYRDMNPSAPQVGTFASVPFLVK